MNRTVTIDDVAAAAGVSTKTVSRVINGEPHVSDRMRIRVESAIAELDYRPNPAARSLAASRTFLIGIITTHLQGFYFPELHRSAFRACREQGFHLALEEPAAEGPDAGRLLERSLRNMRYEGVLVAPSVADDAGVLDVLECCEVPYVRISPAADPERSDAVCADEAQGMAQLARHLWQLGHRRIGLPTDTDDSVIGARADAFVKAWLDIGGEYGDLRFARLDWQSTIVEAGRKFAADLLTGDEPPTAIFAFNDDVAAAVIGYAGGHGLRVPDDLSVAGFDDTDIARLIWPPLTTVRQRFDEMARSAVGLLLEPSTQGVTRRLRVPVDLVVRGSTGPATGVPS